MMNFRLKKTALAEGIAAIYLLIRAVTWYRGFLDHNLIFGYTEEEALKNAIFGGYFGSEELGLIMPLIIMILTEYLTDKEESVFLLRYSGRESYLCVRCARLVVAMVIYNILYMVIGLGYLGLQFSTELMLSERMMRFAFWHFLILFLYAVRTCVLYMILRDMLSKKFLAMGIAMILYLTEFYLVLDQWLYPLIHHEITISSFGDITAAGVVYLGAVPQSVCYEAAARQLVMVILAILIWSLLWRKKDVIRLEG